MPTRTLSSLRLTLSVSALVAASACNMRPQPPPPGEHPTDSMPTVEGAAPSATGTQGGHDASLPHIRVPLTPYGNSKVTGTLILTELPGEAGVQVDGLLSNLTPGKHGMHVHDHADCSGTDGSAAGSHFNPTSAPHGDIEHAHSHLGDLGNIEADAQGKAAFRIVKKGATLGAAADSYMGHSVIVHANPDDLETQPAGESGARLACGLIAPGAR